jgi:hypothetical protein
MTPRELEEYWARVRGARLGRARGRSDGEVTAIAVAYLAATLIILALAVLSGGSSY